MLLIGVLFTCRTHLLMAVASVAVFQEMVLCFALRAATYLALALALAASPFGLLA